MRLSCYHLGLFYEPHTEMATRTICGCSSSFWRGVGQVSDLPVDGVSDSARGQRSLQPADQEVCPTLLAIMRIADVAVILLR